MIVKYFFFMARIVISNCFFLNTLSIQVYESSDFYNRGGPIIKSSRSNLTLIQVNNSIFRISKCSTLIGLSIVCLLTIRHYIIFSFVNSLYEVPIASVIKYIAMTKSNLPLIKFLRHQKLPKLSVRVQLDFNQLTIILIVMFNRIMDCTLRINQSYCSFKNNVFE